MAREGKHVTVAFVAKLIDQQPFKPFTVFGADGASYTVEQLDMVTFSGTGRLLLVYDPVIDQNHVFDVALISRITCDPEVELTAVKM